MMNYYGLGIPLRALLMTLLFVCANAAVALFIRLVKRKRLLHAKVLLPVVMAVNTFFCSAMKTKISPFESLKTRFVSQAKICDFSVRKSHSPSRARATFPLLMRSVSMTSTSK